MATEGWIRIYRSIQDNPLWGDKPFSRGQAWIDLIILANHKSGFIRRRGIKIEVRRGEIGYGYRELSARWGWSIGKIQRFINELKTDTQISFRMDTENVNVTTVITITNYEKYQNRDTETDTEIDTETDTETIRRQVQNKNVKNVKKESLKPIVFTCPIWIPEKPWEAFLEMRAKIKKPLSDHAKQLAVEKLEILRDQGHDPAAVLNQSTFSNWQGLFALKDAPVKAEEEKPTITSSKLARIRQVLPQDEL